MWNLFLRFRNIDRRIIYALVFVVIAIPILVRIPGPVFPSPEATNLKSFIDSLPQGKLVVIAADWQAGTKGECGPLTAAMIEYLMRTKRPFAIFSLVPQGPELAETIARKLARKYGRKYGTDWVNWGFRPNPRTTLIAMNKDLLNFIGKDIHKTPLEKVPCMKGVRSLADVGLVYEVTGLTVTDAYLQFVTKAPLALGCTAVIGPEQYPYVQSGQWKGLLVGLRGAAELETLTGYSEGMGLHLIPAQSFAHLLIIVLIVLGNIGLLAVRKKDASQRAHMTASGEGGKVP